MSRNYIAELDDRVGCMGGKTVHYQSDSRNGCGWFRRREWKYISADIKWI